MSMVCRSWSTKACRTRGRSRDGKNDAALASKARSLASGAARGLAERLAAAWDTLSSMQYKEANI